MSDLPEEEIPFEYQRRPQPHIDSLSTKMWMSVQETAKLLGRTEDQVKRMISNKWLSALVDEAGETTIDFFSVDLVRTTGPSFATMLKSEKKPKPKPKPKKPAGWDPISRFLPRG